ncbi:MAG: hypothetical protein JST32_18060 [Bacteroidetes bacterium]|nr:hypothetical protein [Bacteroidota bacterium]
MTLIWEKITNPDRRDTYYSKLDKIDSAAADKCNILIWYHLIRHGKVLMHSPLIEYSSVRKIIFSDDLAEGYYATLLRDYITLKINELIQETKTVPDHCINRALSIGISEQDIRQALTIRTEKIIFGENGVFDLKKLFEITNQRFDVVRELKTMESKCSSYTGPLDVQYIKKSVELIRLFYMDLLDKIASNCNLNNIVFIGNSLTTIPSFDDVLKRRNEGGTS